jgi:predicted metal-binding protein
MTEEEKQAIRASFAGKRVSQMTEIERKVFDEDFQYGVIAQSGNRSSANERSASKGFGTSVSRFLDRLGFRLK